MTSTNELTPDETICLAQSTLLQYRHQLNKAPNDTTNLKARISITKRFIVYLGGSTEWIQWDRDRPKCP